MNIKFVPAVVMLSVFLAGCGGGGSSGGGNIPDPTPAPTGVFTLTLGDSALDGIEAVNIDIEEITLLGGDGQQQLLTNGVGVINLLDLRNITRLVASTEVPADTYSKIRLQINSLEIIEEGSSSPVSVQLPANGKIDLNPQGPFEISAGENLVVQIDFDLERSIKIVQTGNSKYRFRPVVFIDVIGNLRLTKLFGSIEDDTSGAASDLDLCESVNTEPCFDVDLADGALVLLADGSTVALEDQLLPESGNVFGHFFIKSGGGQFFRALVIVFGAEDSIQSIDGSVTSAVVDSAFDLIENGAVDPTSVQILVGAKVLDQNGATLAFDIAVGQQAEAWAQTSQLDVADANEFPAFLIQVRQDVEEDSVSGTLVAIDDQTLTLSNSDGEVCVTVSSDTDFQLLSDYDGDAETDDISLAELADLIAGGVEVEAFGTQQTDCLAATLIVAEVE